MSRSIVLQLEYLVLFSLIAFSFLVRIANPTFVTLLTLTVVFISVGYSFYYYVVDQMYLDIRKGSAFEYSWGQIVQDKISVSIKSLLDYLITKEVGFYRKYIEANTRHIIIGIFIFADIIIAFKNLDLHTTGLYILMSLFTKFVFYAVFYLHKIYEKSIVIQDKENAEEEVLKIFSVQVSSFLSIFAVLFIVFFILSKYIVEIFFGYSFSPYQSSLPFILLGNISLATMFLIFITALKLDRVVTTKLLKLYSAVFMLLFIFVNNNYIDTVTYFVIGMSSLLTILLYNFVIKKPEYIRGTYNLLF